MIVLDKFRGGRELVPGRELVHHHYTIQMCTDNCSTTIMLHFLQQSVNMQTDKIYKPESTIQ